MRRIETRHLTKRFGEVTALDDVSLTVDAGEVFCLLGPNGAGKTTLLNTLLGFVRDVSGEALVNGIDVVRDPQRARPATAFIPELVMLYPTLTGLENLRFFCELAGRREYSRHDLLAFLAEAQLEAAAAERRVSTYSKGMRQKVGIAIALAKRADVLLLDEPTSGLDPASSSEFTAAVARMAARGCAVLMTTHDLLRAKTASTRVGIMRRGRLAATFESAAIDSLDLERAYLDHISR